jgi:hypothetical protein
MCLRGRVGGVQGSAAEVEEVRWHSSVLLSEPSIVIGTVKS